MMGVQVAHKMVYDKLKYMKEYNKRPEVKRRMKEYLQKPEVILRRKKMSQSKEHKEKTKEYLQKPEVKEMRRLWQIKYRETAKGKAIYKKYDNSDRAREKSKIRAREFRKTTKYKDWVQKYRKSKGRKVVLKRYTSGEKFKIQQKRFLNSERGKNYVLGRNSRRRNMGMIQIMDNPFPMEIKVDRHHINDLLVIPMPKLTHSKQGGLQKTHRDKCNNVLDSWGINISNFMRDGSACT